MSVAVITINQHLDGHELQGSGATASATRRAAELLGKVQVDQHSRVAGLVAIRDDNVVFRDISVKNVSLDIERLMRLDCIPERFQQFQERLRLMDARGEYDETAKNAVIVSAVIGFIQTGSSH